MSKYIEKAQECRANTERHYNCAQSVLIPFAQEAGIPEEQAYHLAALFGGGMDLGSTCGAVTGALMVLGALHPLPTTAREIFCDRWAELHEGCFDCPDLLEKAAAEGIEKKANCDGLVMDAVALLEELLKDRIAG